MNTPLKINLGYKDARSAIDFLVNILGFEEVFVYTGESENVVAHAELQWPDGGAVTLHSTDPTQNSIPDLADRATKDGGYPAYSVHIDTNNPEAIYDRVIKGGVKVIREMNVTSRGRGFIVSDPEGLYWSIGTPLPKLVRNAAGQWQPAE